MPCNFRAKFILAMMNWGQFHSATTAIALFFSYRKKVSIF
jgi:hypothetical protein